MVAIAARADAIVTFNLRDFASDYLCAKLEMDVVYPDQFVLDLIDFNEQRAVVAIQELRARKLNPPWSVDELIERIRRGGLLQTASWLESEDVRPLL